MKAKQKRQKLHQFFNITKHSNPSQNIPTHHKTKQKHSILSKTKTNPIPSPHKEACLAYIPKLHSLPCWPPPNTKSLPTFVFRVVLLLLTAELISVLVTTATTNTNKDKGVCHTVALPFDIKKYLKAKEEELWKLKYFTMPKYNLQKNPLKETQNPSRYLS
jgi:hypothetical protein